MKGANDREQMTEEQRKQQATAAFLEAFAALSPEQRRALFKTYAHRPA